MVEEKGEKEINECIYINKLLLLMCFIKISIFNNCKIKLYQFFNIHV